MTSPGTNVYFGVKWPARAFHDALQIEAPVGQRCLLCKEQVVEGESGIMMAYSDGRESGVRPEHIECFLRSIRGSVRHLEERCSCFDPDAPDDADDMRPYREQARETMEWLVLHGQ